MNPKHLFDRIEIMLIYTSTVLTKYSPILQTGLCEYQTYMNELTPPYRKVTLLFISLYRIVIVPIKDLLFIIPS